MKLAPRLKSYVLVATPIVLALLLTIALLPAAALATSHDEPPPAPGSVEPPPPPPPLAGGSRPPPVPIQQPPPPAPTPNTAGPQPTPTSTTAGPQPTPTSTTAGQPPALPTPAAHPSAPRTPPVRLRRGPCRYPGPAVPHRWRPAVLLHRPRRQFPYRALYPPLQRTGYAPYFFRLALQRHQSLHRQVGSDPLPALRAEDPDHHLLPRFRIRHQQALQLHRRVRATLSTMRLGNKMAHNRLLHETRP